MDKTLQWVLVGTLLVNLGAIVYTTGQISAQTTNIQNELTEIKTMVDGLRWLVVRGEEKEHSK